MPFGLRLSGLMRPLPPQLGHLIGGASSSLSPMVADRRIGGSVVSLVRPKGGAGTVQTVGKAPSPGGGVVTPLPADVGRRTSALPGGPPARRTRRPRLGPPGLALPAGRGRRRGPGGRICLRRLADHAA